MNLKCTRDYKEVQDVKDGPIQVHLLQSGRMQSIARTIISVVDHDGLMKSPQCKDSRAKECDLELLMTFGSHGQRFGHRKFSAACDAAADDALLTSVSLT